MNSVLLGAGLACLIGAIVGGGLRGFGVELPLLQSVRRQILLGALGVVLLGASAADKLQAFLHPPQDQTATQDKTAAAKDETAKAATASSVLPKPATSHTSAAATQTAATPQAAAAANANVAAARDQLQGARNRLQVAIHDGNHANCEVALTRLNTAEANLAAAMKSLNLTYIPDVQKTPPPLDPCPDG